ETAYLSGVKTRRSDPCQVAAATDVEEQSERTGECAPRHSGEPRQVDTRHRPRRRDDVRRARGVVHAAQRTRLAQGASGPSGLYPQAERLTSAWHSYQRRSMCPSHGEKRAGTILGSSFRGGQLRVSPWSRMSRRDRKSFSPGTARYHTTMGGRCGYRRCIRFCMLMPPSRTRKTCLRSNIAPLLAGEDAQHIDMLCTSHAIYLYALNSLLYISNHIRAIEKWPYLLT